MSFMVNFSYDLMAHELAHQWFGDMVTCGTWQDLWLNEGFAGLAEGHSGENAAPTPTGRALPLEALERPFTELPNEQVSLAYAQSRMRVGRMVDLCGWSALGELMRQLGNGLPWEAAVAEAYAPCGYDWPRLQAEINAGG